MTEWLLAQQGGNGSIAAPSKYFFSPWVQCDREKLDACQYKIVLCRRTQLARRNRCRDPLDNFFSFNKHSLGGNPEMLLVEGPDIIVLEN